MFALAIVGIVFLTCVAIAAAATLVVGITNSYTRMQRRQNRNTTDQ